MNKSISNVEFLKIKFWLDIHELRFKMISWNGDGKMKNNKIINKFTDDTLLLFKQENSFVHHFCICETHRWVINFSFLQLLEKIIRLINAISSLLWIYTIPLVCQTTIQINWTKSFQYIEITKWMLILPNDFSIKLVCWWKVTKEKLEIINFICSFYLRNNLMSHNFIKLFALASKRIQLHK